MKPTTEILANMSRNSSAHHDEVFTRVYRYLLRPDLYFAAYKRLQANNGADTRGVNDDTADGFSERKINCIIEALKNGSYEPLPVRRTYIRKKNSPAKKRPLGLPTFTDKLVQDVMRMVLEAIYEPVFSDLSHGFRARVKRSSQNCSATELTARVGSWLFFLVCRSLTSMTGQAGK